VTCVYPENNGSVLEKKMYGREKHYLPVEISQHEMPCRSSYKILKRDLQRGSEKLLVNLFKSRPMHEI